MHGDFFVCHGFALQHDHATRQSTSDAILSQFPKCRPDVISLRLFSTSEIMGHVNRVATCKCNCFLLLFHEEFLSTFGEAYTYRTGFAGSCAGSVCCVTPPQSFCTKYVRRSDPARDQLNSVHELSAPMHPPLVQLQELPAGLRNVLSAQPAPQSKFVPYLGWIVQPPPV